VISRFHNRATRLEWRHRIEDHDGDVDSEGGIERWLKLTEGLELDTAYVESTEGIPPATRFAIDVIVFDRSTLDQRPSRLKNLRNSSKRRRLFASGDKGDCRSTAGFKGRRRSAAHR
jgi:pyrroloquinoline-quinone synthase